MARGSDAVQVKARLPMALRKKLEAAAEDSGISLNAEIVGRLERSFDRQNVIQDFVAALDHLRRDGEEFGKFDYKTYFLVNTLLGLQPRSREEWERQPEPPTAEEFDAVKQAHEGKRK